MKTINITNIQKFLYNGFLITIGDKVDAVSNCSSFHATFDTISEAKKAIDNHLFKMKMAKAIRTNYMTA
jgi:hypothetical protein